MIIWGSKGNSITIGRVETRYCPICEKEREFFVTMIYRYGHIFWIPLFSWSTKYFYHCSTCERGVEIKGSEVKPYMISNQKPWMHRYGWLVAIAIIIVLVLIPW